MGNAALIKQMNQGSTILHIGPHGSGKSMAALNILKNLTNCLYFDFQGSTFGTKKLAPFLKYSNPIDSFLLLFERIDQWKISQPTIIFDQLDYLRNQDYDTFKQIIGSCHNFHKSKSVRCIIVESEGWKFRDFKKIISAGVQFDLSYSRYLSISETLKYWKHIGINKLFKEDDSEVELYECKQKQQDNKKGDKFSAFCYAFERYGGNMRSFDTIKDRAQTYITQQVIQLKAQKYPGQKNITMEQEKDIYQRAIQRVLFTMEQFEEEQLQADFNNLSLNMKKLCVTQKQYKFMNEVDDEQMAEFLHWMFKLTKTTDIYGDLGMLVEGSKIWGQNDITDARQNVLIYGNVLTVYVQKHVRYIGFQTPAHLNKAKKYFGMGQCKNINGKKNKFIIDIHVLGQDPTQTLTDIEKIVKFEKISP